LAVYSKKPSNQVINKAEEWFGEENIANLDKVKCKNQIAKF
jgi:hypothetical protein